LRATTIAAGFWSEEDEFNAIKRRARPDPNHFHEVVQ